MVEYNDDTPVTESSAGRLDAVFGSLADATRRDILHQVAGRELTVGDIARQYQLTFAAISKHIKILEQAGLICKRRQGREMFVSLAPAALRDADTYLAWHRQRMERRFDALEEFLQRDKPAGRPEPPDT